MTILTVLRFPDERLRTKAEPVSQVTDETRKIIDDMIDTMRDENGIGLAATQVNIHQQIVVMDVSEEGDDLKVFINPKIVNKGDETAINEEGCLSVPGTYAKVPRHTAVTIEALDRNGEPFTTDATELLAICIQHELDHLNGVLFIDYLSPLKRQRIKTKLEKEARLASKA